MKKYEICKCVDDKFSTCKLKVNCAYFYDPEKTFFDIDEDEYLEIYSYTSNPQFIGRYLATRFKKL